MGGLWKLAAMSAVIGAGLVVVWQAQNGLQGISEASIPTAPALGETPGDTSHIAGATGEASTTTGDLRPSPELTPVREGTPTAVYASIPPQQEMPTTLQALDPASDQGDAAVEEANSEDLFAAASPPDAAAMRYSRGLDFRRQGELDAQNADSADLIDKDISADSPLVTASAMEPVPEVIAEPAPLQLALASDDAPALLPVPDSGNLPAPSRALASTPSKDKTSPEKIQLTAGEQPPVRAAIVQPETTQDDPFFDAAPPDLSAPSLSTPKPGAARAVPMPAQPEAEFDPFGDAPAPRPATPPARQPAPVEAPFDPFGEADPGTPELKPAPAAMPEMNRLPDAQPEADPFDPFPEDLAPSGTTPAPAAGTPRARSTPPLPLDIGPDAAPLPARMPATEPDEFDPFEGSAPPQPLRSDSPQPNAAPPAAVPEPEIQRAPVNPQPAATPRESTPPQSPAGDMDLFQGDGEMGTDTPRGVQEPRLTIEKFAPSSAILGQPLVYSVIVKNVGGSPATQVTVEDRIPKGTRLVGTAPQAEMIEKRLVWRKLGTLQPGEERKISIKVIPEEEGPIGSVAKVSFVSEVTAEIVVRAPKLKVSVNAPTDVKVGSTVPLVFLVSNPGNGEATNVVLRSIIPEGLEHPAGSDLEYTVGTLAPNGSREVRLEVTAMKPGRVTHQTVVSADGNLTSESRGTIEILGEQLLLTRSGHDRVYLGRNAIFTNSVTNEGQTPLTGVTLTEGVPEGFDFVSATHGGTYTSANRSVSWNLGSLPPGGAATVSVTVLAKTLGRYDTTVTAVGPNGSTASVRPTVAIEGYPALALEQLGEQRLVGVGETLTTRIQLQNRGTAMATRVGLTVDVPAELKFVSASGPSPYRVEGQRLMFEPVDQIDARGTTAYELVFEALSPGDNRLELQISADHLRRPVRHDEAVQVLPASR